MFDVLDRARAGKPPLADLSAMVPIMKIIEDAYAQGRPMKVVQPGGAKMPQQAHDRIDNSAIGLHNI